MPSRTARASRAVIAIALATALAVPAATAAQFDAFIKFPPSVADSDGRKSTATGEIEIQSFSWGASQPSHAGGGGGGMGAGKVSMQDMSVMRGPRQTTAMDGTQVTTGDVDGDGAADAAAAHTVKSPRDAASGQASGKRTHDPVKFEKPLEKGSIMLKMTFPGCAVGTRYPSAEMTTPTGRYLLTDVQVTSCPTAAAPGGAEQPSESISLNYTKIVVRG